MEKRKPTRTQTSLASQPNPAAHLPFSGPSPSPPPFSSPAQPRSPARHTCSLTPPRPSRTPLSPLARDRVALSHCAPGPACHPPPPAYLAAQQSPAVIPAAFPSWPARRDLRQPFFKRPATPCTLLPSSAATTNPRAQPRQAPPRRSSTPPRSSSSATPRPRKIPQELRPSARDDPAATILDHSTGTRRNFTGVPPQVTWSAAPIHHRR